MVYTPPTHVSCHPMHGCWAWTQTRTTSGSVWAWRCVFCHMHTQSGMIPDPYPTLQLVTMWHVPGHAHRRMAPSWCCLA
jgi:hypothetical protein